MVKMQINGISITREREHYLLQKDGIQMRCDVGELNECIPELEDYLTELKGSKGLQTA